MTPSVSTVHADQAAQYAVLALSVRPSEVIEVCRGTELRPSSEASFLILSVGRLGSFRLSSYGRAVGARPRRAEKSGRIAERIPEIVSAVVRNALRLRGWDHLNAVVRPHSRNVAPQHDDQAG